MNAVWKLRFEDGLMDRNIKQKRAIQQKMELILKCLSGKLDMQTKQKTRINIDE